MIHILTANENFSPTTDPIEPPKKVYSTIHVIAGVLFTVPLKTSKASFSPVFSCVDINLSLYFSLSLNFKISFGEILLKISSLFVASRNISALFLADILP